MNEQTKYLLNRIAQITGQYESQVLQLIGVIDEREKTIAGLEEKLKAKEGASE